MEESYSKIKILYKSIDDDIIFTFVIPVFILLTFVGSIIRLYIKATLLESNINWENNKCIPKYMFFSGFIKPTPGVNALTATYDNFSQCVKKNKTHMNVTLKNNLIYSFHKILMAFDVNIEVDQLDQLSVEELTKNITFFLNRSGMTQSDVDNSTVEEIKKKIESVGKANFRGG